MRWLREAIERLQRGEPLHLVTVAATKGSAPREAGAKMLVSEDDFVGTIGGGALELGAIERARQLIAERDRERRHEPVALGPALGQCCGGSTELVFEPLHRSQLSLLRDCLQWRSGESIILVTPLSEIDAPKQLYKEKPAPPGLAEYFKAGDSDADARIVKGPDGGLSLVERFCDRRTAVWLFGAGHVGRAVARALEPLPFHLTWVDDRPGFLPEAETDDARPLFSRTPHLEVASVPTGALVLIMSHSHGLDFDITDAALRRGDLGFVGLIGSATKRAQFARRARAHGLSETALGRLVSPIGLANVRGKAPAVIAASVAAQLLEVAEGQAAAGRNNEQTPMVVESA